jgi:hypothetical protein
MAALSVPGQWRVKALIGDAEPREALGAELFGEVGQLVELAAREAGAARDADRLHGGGAEGLHLGVGEDLGEVLEDHGETQVGLVGAVVVQRLGPGHRRDGPGTHAGGGLGRVEHRARHEAEHVVLADETGLEVELGEFELTIGAQVLVAQASRDLVVPVEAADHQKLLGDLGALGQHVELTGVPPRGHHELARALGRRGPEQWRLDLAEALGVHGPAQGGVDERTQSQVALHLFAAKVEEPVAQANLFVDVVSVIELKGRWLGYRQHLDGAVGQFDLAGREPVVRGALGTTSHRARNAHHVLAAHVDRPVDDRLDQTGTVADVEKREVFTVLAALRDPAAHAQHAPDVGLVERGAQQVTQARGFMMLRHGHFNRSVG